jgi:phospholipid/cholesterol/gamma-HCH transport system ATP-binding protein
VYDNLALYLREHRVANEAGIRDKVMRALQILSLDNAAQKFPLNFPAACASASQFPGRW